MFDSQSLSRKGPLASVWVAAYCHKRLKKAQVTDTDIPFSVDKILQDDFEVVTYRVWGFFLLGVVRIYSKKVEYLFNDCHKVLVQVKSFVIGEKSSSRASRVPGPPLNLITVPKRFELDEFDLEVGDDASNAHEAAVEDITLKDNTWRHRSVGHYALQEYTWEDLAGSHDMLSTDSAGAEDVVSSAFMDAEASVERPMGSTYSQENRVCLLTFEGQENRAYNGDNQVEKEQMRNPEVASPTETEKYFSEEESHRNNSEVTIERLQEDMELEKGSATLKAIAPSDGDKCSDGEEEHDLSNLETIIEMLQEDGEFEKRNLDFEVVAPINEVNQELNGAETEVYSPSKEADKLSEIVPPAIPEPDVVEMLREDGELEKRNMYVEVVAPSSEVNQELNDAETKVDSPPKEADKLLEIVSPAIPEPDVVMKDSSLLLTVNSTPPQKISNTGEGVPTPEFMLIPTPTPRERPRTKRKRKCVFDDLIVLPNDLIKETLRDTSDLVCKRRKTPYNAFSAWKTTRALVFSAPLFPYSSSELLSLYSGKNLKISRPREDVERPGKVKVPEPPSGDGSFEQVERPEKLKLLEPPSRDGFLEQVEIAPETPVRQFPSRRPFESPKAAIIDEMTMEIPCGSVTFEKEQSVLDDQELGSTLMNEELNPVEEETYGWTGRTRTVARHLSKVFQRQKGEAEAASLSRISKGRTRKESARLFYEILVLKSRDYIDVEQEAAYTDVLIRKLSKWDQAFNADGSEQCA